MINYSTGNIKVKLSEGDTTKYGTQDEFVLEVSSGLVAGYSITTSHALTVEYYCSKYN